MASPKPRSRLRFISLVYQNEEDQLVLNYTLDGQPQIERIDILAHNIEDAQRIWNANKIIRKCLEVDAVFKCIEGGKVMAPTTASSLNSLASKRSVTPSKQISINQITEYIEQLYESMEIKTEATAAIREIAAQNNAYVIQELSENDALMSALARVLLEDTRKNMDLTANILATFHSISNHPQFHEVLTKNKIGDMSMKIMSYEMERTDMLSSKTAVRKQSIVLLYALGILYNLAQDLSIEAKMVKRNIIETTIQLLPRSSRLCSLGLNMLQKLSIVEDNAKKIASFGREISSSMKEVVPPHPLLHNVLPFPEFSAACVWMLPSLPHNLQYLLSIHHCAQFAYQNQCEKIVNEFLSHTTPSYHLTALVVNLASYNTTAEQILEDTNVMRAIMRRALAQPTALNWKIVRGLSLYAGSKQVIAENVEDVERLLDEPPDVAVEVWGALANIACGIPECALHVMNIALNGDDQDDILLQIIILIGNCAEDYAEEIMNLGIWKKTIEALSAKIDDNEILLQSLYAIYKFCETDNLRALISSQNLTMNTVLELSFHHCKEVSTAAESCLEILADHSLLWKERSREARFGRHNAEWFTTMNRAMEVHGASTDGEGDDYPRDRMMGGGKGYSMWTSKEKMDMYSSESESESRDLLREMHLGSPDLFV